MEYNYEYVMEQLASMADPKRYEFNKKHGVTGEQYGIPSGKIRSLAKKIKVNHKLGIKLWNSKNYEAMIVGAMLLNVKELKKEEIYQLLEQAYIPILIDEFVFYAAGYSQCSKELMNELIENENNTLYCRAGWDMAIVLNKEKQLNTEEKEMLLRIIESILKEAPPIVQEAMNRCLCEIGFRDDKYTDRCIAIGEKLGVYKDMKVSKGCTSSYAPAWINAVVNKKK
jgi:3-methyladenine DNA glycosylase AlkD